MALFEEAIKHILAWEGYYVNDPDDLGKITYRGITKKNHPRWSGWAIIDTCPPDQLHYNKEFPELEDKVKSFYQVEYWNKIMGASIKDQRVATFLLDWFVNSGYHAVAAAQKITGCTVDNVMGLKTVAAINRYEGDLFAKLKEERIKFVHRIVINRPNQSKFLKGWLNRINSFS